MEKLESPYNSSAFGLSQDFFTKRKVEELWEKVDEIVDYINEKEKRSKKSE